jgi:hypothetical protein
MSNTFSPRCLLLSVLLLSPCISVAQVPPPQTPAAKAPAVSAKVLEGKWVVDLRGAPGDAAYTQPFVVNAVDEAKRSISGNFYNSDISWSRINTAWGKVVVTFVTSDGQGDYVHTATLQGDTLVGTSTARHRNMLVPWTATRQP